MTHFLKQLAGTQIDANSVGIPEVQANDATFTIIVNTIFIFIGGWAVLFLLIGSFRYVTSNGDQNLITKAKDTILYAIIGIVLSISAFAIVQFVLGRVV